MTMKTFEQVFRERYGDLLPKGDVNSEHKISCKTVEFVGMEKVAEQIAAKPIELDLSNQELSSCGQVSEDVKSKLADVTELNLSRNLLRSWLDVVDIVALFPNLRRIVVTGNKLEVPSDYPLSDVLRFKKIMKNVKSVVFGDACMSWYWIQLVDSHVLSFELESLDVFRNNISEINKIPPTSFTHLKHLNISDNKIVSWSQISQLGTLKE